MDRPTEYLILAPEIHRDVQSRLTSRRNRDETAYDECHPSLMLLNAQVLAYHCVKREMGRRCIVGLPRRKVTRRSVFPTRL
ncbi:uncharacterized protein PHALS_05456 [Plasmopara halstedii]|uniref:Uncharacterized protein n=1 Tax=Plasmopara halstedii TaxID=4781 RepID=A0A0P1B275_PLAHL|nr:uncharacterized protein PHALS_05456 [Plasmopara halstedii]CEG47973.1 hypothetical protein PHALS_05456 [Plasmopara halstedii]|eukprot:XP_024584342.1 hypothetical protein PHALS_05456 [Plasmopara halstedii]